MYHNKKLNHNISNKIFKMAKILDMYKIHKFLNILLVHNVRGFMNDVRNVKVADVFYVHFVHIKLINMCHVRNVKAYHIFKVQMFHNNQMNLVNLKCDKASSDIFTLFKKFLTVKRGENKKENN
jgi:hypothetical protein